MLYSGLKISQGTTLPSNPQEGQLAVLSQVDGSYQPGTYVRRGAQWRVMDSSSQTLSVNEGTGIDASITGDVLSIAVDTATIATKEYVDALKQGFDYKDSVRAATTANITLSGLQTIDGVSLVAGDRVLVKNQTPMVNRKYNGIYVVADGAWTRAADATAGNISSGMYCMVEEGTTQAGMGFVLSTANPIVVDTTGLTFVMFGTNAISAGYGLTKSGSTISADIAVLAERTYVNDQDTSTLNSANAYTNLIKARLETKDPVRAATTTNITLSGLQTIDGVSLAANDRVLVKNQTTASQNGIYTAVSGTWIRVYDASDDASVSCGLTTYVEEGTTQAGSVWTLTTANPITLNTTALTFTQYNGPMLTFANGLTKTGNTVSLSSTFTPYDICSCVLGKPDAGATVFMALAVRSFTIPSSYTGSQAKASVSATASSVFTIYKNGSSIGTFTFAASGSTATFSGAGASIVAGDLLTVVAPGSQDATLANIAFTIAGNLQ